MNEQVTSPKGGRLSRLKLARKELLSGLLDKHGQKELADQTGMSSAFLWQMAKGEGKSARGVSDENARKIESALGLPDGWLDGGKPDVESVDTKPISNGDATHAHDDQNALRRVRIMGAVQMDADGYWVEGDAEAETYAYRTDDQGAYAIRILSQRFQPVLASGQCVIVSPAADLKPGRHALVVLADGRRTVRTFHSHEHGIWHFTSITDANVYLDMEDVAVARVDRVMGFVWTD